MTDAGSMTWSLGPDVDAVAAVDPGTKSGAGHDNLEEIYADIDSLVDTTEDRKRNSVAYEDDPLAEFEAWIASGAVQIVDKL